MSPCPHFFTPIKKTNKPAKRNWIPSLTLGKTSRGPTTQTTTWKEGGGGLIARHSRGVCAVLVFDLLAHPHPREILCCVVLCICLCQSVCVWGGGGGVGPQMPMHASNVLVWIGVCVLPLQPTPTLVFLTCDTCLNVFDLVVF